MLKKYLYSGLLLLTITTCVGTVIKAEETPVNVADQEQVVENEVFERVFGGDNRVNITDTTKGFFPKIVKIEGVGYYSASGSYVPLTGTGTLVASDVVLTSAHVVYSVDKNEYFTDIKVTPATSDGSVPFGVSTATVIKINPAYSSNPSHQNDYAVIKLSKPLGTKTGYLMLSTNIQSGDYAQTAGYPGDRPGQMVFASGNIDTLSDSELNYKIDTRGDKVVVLF